MAVQVCAKAESFSEYLLSHVILDFVAGLDQLKKATAPGAFHDSRERFDPPECHPQTRLAVLAKIIDRVEKKIDTDSFILWLWDAAGAVCHRADNRRALPRAEAAPRQLLLFS